MKLFFKILSDKRWLITSILFSFVLILITAPKPWSKTTLWFKHDETLELSTQENQEKINEVLSSIFSIPLLFQKFDLVFENTSDRNCDFDFPIATTNDSEFKKLADKYFKEKQERGILTDYNIPGGEKVTIYSISKNTHVKYGTSMLMHIIDPRPTINSEGELRPDPNCPTPPWEGGDLSKYGNFFEYGKIYVKPNLLNWLTGLLCMFFVSIVFIGSLRSVWENNQSENNKNKSPK